MVQVQHLPIYHMPKAVASFHRAFTKDPVQNYLFEDEESTATSWRPVARKLLRGVRYSLLWVKYNVWGFTFGLDGGAAYTIGALAKNSVAKKDLFLRAALFAITILEYPLAVLNRLAIFIVFTPQQRQRAKEITSKMESTIARTLGDAAEDYIFLDTLCCAPEKQGRGYGGILVRSVTKIADEQRRKVWLLSSNIKNNKFYRSQGFEVVTEIIVGDSGPTYRGEPVVVEMMIYDPSK